MTEQENGTMSVVTADGSLSMNVRLQTERLTLPLARKLAEDGGIVVACGGVDLEVMTAPLLRNTQQAVVVEPAVLVETVAEIISLAKPEEHTEPESDLVPEDDGYADYDSDSLFDDAPDLPDASASAPGLGYELAGAEIAKMLLAAPPLMTRSDMVRLVDGMRIDNALSPEAQS